MLKILGYINEEECKYCNKKQKVYNLNFSGDNLFICEDCLYRLVLWGYERCG